ncbi:acyl-CoA dehydrogenase family protein [Candidatus Poriferisocius sp.]|uniref:acyl-CoA dehydrogenase family protein n=1 Tax=Candidatus Poriferisocius sp. TaxID=3101276 RepID=UPI003B01E1D5
MRVDLNDDQEFFRATTRRFVESETPISVIREWHDHPDGCPGSWWQAAAGLGWTSLMVPESLGGGSVSGRPIVDLAIVADEMGRGLVPGPFMPVNVVADTLARSGTPDQQALLEGVMAGGVVPAWAFCEPGGDWTADHVATEAVPTGGGYVITGTKTAVEAGAQAHHLLVTARTSDGPAQFLLPGDTPGITITPQESLDLGRRFAEVRFAEVFAGPDTLVGVPGEATSADVERQCRIMLVLQCADSAGAAARVLEFTVEYAFNRYSFGRPLASYQALKHRFADMKLWSEASQAVTDGAADAMASGEDEARMVSVAKSYVGDHSVELMQDCVQLHGGIGVTWEHDLHLYLRRVTVNRGLFGSSADHRERLAMALGL